MTEFLKDLFHDHGVEAVVEGDEVVFPRQLMRGSAAIVRDQPQKNIHSVQLDVRLRIGLGRTLVESFGGFGATRERAIADAQSNFVANSFHVLHAAFFSEHDDQVRREQWAIGGRPKRVTLGTIGIRGQSSEVAAVAPEWFKKFEAQLRSRNLRPGTHWLRYYYAQVDHRPLSCEVLLDNEVWQELQSVMAAEAGPLGSGFLSLRVFLVVQDGMDISEAASVLYQMRESDDGAVAEALTARGATPAEADRFVAYLPLAFGRVLLHGMGIGFSSTVILRNYTTGASREVALDDEEIFVEAARLAEEAHANGTMSREEFSALALCSAEVNAVNNALHGGSKPEDLVCSPTVVNCSGIGE
jgi:hypothetical protein